MSLDNQSATSQDSWLDFNFRKQALIEDQANITSFAPNSSIEDTFGTTTISSMDSLEDDLLYDEEHIAHVIDTYLRLHYPHLFETEETKDVATQCYENECRYQEFIQFYKQYEFDRKRVSYD